uniref:Uncharacterized protein n=1 Tax=Arundo donax TaxID=35708 RepID=A0A0A8ZUB8_ARUDO
MAHCGIPGAKTSIYVNRFFTGPSMLKPI